MSGFHICPIGPLTAVAGRCVEDRRPR
jgi:hypothetical protein